MNHQAKTNTAVAQLENALKNPFEAFVERTAESTEGREAVASLHAAYAVGEAGLKFVTTVSPEGALKHEFFIAPRNGDEVLVSMLDSPAAAWH